MNAATIQQYLQGVDFPCTRDELVEHAQSQGAPDDVISVLENLPDREYSSTAELMAHARGSMQRESDNESDDMM